MMAEVTFNIAQTKKADRKIHGEKSISPLSNTSSVFSLKK